MVKQNKPTRITQSGKNCAIQGTCIIWKQNIWLTICEFLNLVPRVSHLSAPGVKMRDPGNPVLVGSPFRRGTNCYEIEKDLHFAYLNIEYVINVRDNPASEIAQPT